MCETKRVKEGTIYKYSFVILCKMKKPKPLIYKDFGKKGAIAYVSFAQRNHHWFWFLSCGQVRTPLQQARP